MVKFYMDAHVPRPIAKGLLQRGVDILTVQQDGNESAADDALLTRATMLQRVLVTMDRDFERLVAHTQARGAPISGVVAFSRKLSYRQVIDDLELIAKCSESKELADRLTILPL